MYKIGDMVRVTMPEGYRDHHGIAIRDWVDANNKTYRIVHINTTKWCILENSPYSYNFKNAEHEYNNGLTWWWPSSCLSAVRKDWAELF